MSENVETISQHTRNLAEASLFEAQAERERQLARFHRVQAESAELSLLTKKRENEFTLASNVHNHIFPLSGVIDEASTAMCEEHLTRWARMDPGCDLKVIINTPGGNSVDGMYLYDCIQELKRAGHEVTIQARGWAASMGSILLQAASPGKRQMGAEAAILIHQPSAGVAGSIEEIADYTRYMEMSQDRILDIYAAGCEYARQKGTATNPKTRAQLKVGWRRTDWWISSTDALAFGLVDEVK